MWKTINSKIVHENNWWKIKKDQFELEDKTIGHYEYVDSPGGVIIVPITKNNNILLIKQYRYPNSKTFFEFPAGGVKGSIYESAKRELEEETGFTSEKLTKVVSFYPYTGLSNEICHVFIALNLKKTDSFKEKTEDIVVLEVKYDEVEKKLKETCDGKAITSWQLVKDIIKNESKKQD